MSCLVASGEVHGQESTGTLAEAMAEHMDGAQPSRDQFTNPAPRRGANVLGAVGDSFRLLTMQHAIRIGFQEKTRRELDGPFFKDYANSVRVPHTWGDGDGWVVNYLGHPAQGATSGWVWINNDPGAEQATLGLSRRYWTSRARALAWSAAYSTQFEIGPYSEASIGNVGLDPKTTGWTDYVATPLGGFAMIIAEDAIDQHFLVWLERRTRQKPLRAIVRSFATPNRSMANLASGRWPWHREGRPLGELGRRPRNEFITTQAEPVAPRGTAVAIGAPAPEGLVIPER
ncbi:hypothetical protein TBR22_A42410 [Luteitalea sp. TBR-22]|nr:hypothetical protein TBR22_A42410 [Luteitalea sp. TBR-22]